MLFFAFFPFVLLSLFLSFWVKEKVKCSYFEGVYMLMFD
jgi:Zn-dependent membrane protease YugP